ncbi:MAG: hypothetical protein QW210_04500 [Candidatus Woesearchaeota archaeon]
MKKTNLEEILKDKNIEENRENNFLKKVSDIEEKVYEIIIIDYQKNNKNHGRHFFSFLFGSFFSLSENIYLQSMSFPFTYFSYYLGKKSLEKNDKKYYNISLGISVALGTALYCSLRFLKREPIDFFELTRLNISFFNISTFITNYYYKDKKKNSE